MTVKHPITTIQGQRLYPIPSGKIMDVLCTIGNYTYKLQARTELYLDQIDWGTSFWSGYPTDYSFLNGQIRLFPPTQGGLPVTVELEPVETEPTPPTVPELAEALQKLVDTFGVRHETHCRFDCDESPDCGTVCSCEAHSFQAEIVSLLARITPK